MENRNCNLKIQATGDQTASFNNQTPEEMLEEVYLQIRQDLVQNILDKVKE